MKDSIVRFESALDTFDCAMHELTRDRLSRPTPCADWDVSDLVNHVVGEAAWVAPLLAGRTIAEVGAELDGDLLGPDPCASWHHWSALAHSAFIEDGADERTVHLSYGDERAAAYCDQLCFDLLIHSWDLARGTGQDDTLPSSLVSWAQQWFAPMAAAYRGAGIVAPPVAAPAGAAPQDELLAMTGRRSSWRA